MSSNNNSTPENESSFISRITSAVSMSDILNEFGIDSSRNPTNCPLHSSVQGKCLSWADEVSHCFHCQADNKGWNKYTFVREVKRFNDYQTMEWFAQKAGMIEEFRNSGRFSESDEEMINDYVETKDSVIMHLAMKKSREATERICAYIKNREHIYTTRDDEKSEVWIYKEGIYVNNGKTYIKELCRDILDKAYTPHLANEVISKIESDTYIDQKEFFKESSIDEIPVKNGLLNIHTKILSSFSPDKRYFNKLPVIYDTNKDCPNIKRFLSQIHKHEEDIKIVQEWFGYCLLKDYRIEKTVMLIGRGRNGKSKELDLLKIFLGPENCVNISLQDMEKDNFALSELHGKLANISGDISKEALNHTGNLKMLTGGDMISANRKFKNRIPFVNYAKLIYSANELPITYDLTDAFFLRWILLEFPYKFLSQKELDTFSPEEKETRVNGKLKYNLADKEIISRIVSGDELSGLLNFALEGLRRLLEKRDFSYSKSMVEVKNEWIRRSNTFQAFCMDNVIKQGDGVETKEELRRAYADYCEVHNVVAIGDKAIKETLTREYGVSEGQKKVLSGNNFQEFDYKNAWFGIKLRQQTQNE